MTRSKRRTLRELREQIWTGTLNDRVAIVRALDGMHDRLRDDVIRALNSAVNNSGGFVTLNGKENVLVAPHTQAYEAIRAVFDRRRRHD